MPQSLASLLVHIIFSTKKRSTEALSFENEFSGFLRKYEIESPCLRLFQRREHFSDSNDGSHPSLLNLSPKATL